MMATNSSFHHASAVGLTYESNVPLPPAPPCGPSHMEAGANNNPAHLQQKMLKQRQLALERQRNAARNRLGVSIIAQANPLAASSTPAAGPSSTTKQQLERCRLLKGTPSPAVAQPRKASHGEAAGNCGAPAVAVSAPLGKAPTAARRDSMDDILDSLVVEELSEEPHHRGARHRGPTSSGAQQGSEHSWPHAATNANAWGGSTGFTAQHGSQAPAPFSSDIIEEVMAEFSLPVGRNHGHRTSPGEALGAEGGCPERQTLPSWDLNVGGTPEVEQAQGVEGRRGNGGRRWWKKWQNPEPVMEMREETEVTNVCAFASD